MKASDGFKTAIENYLKEMAATDELFAETLKKPAKNINDCINYIFTTVQKSGINGYSDAEVFGMAVHYYDEDDIKPGKAVNARVVVNHHVGASKKSDKLADGATKKDVIDHGKNKSEIKTSAKKKASAKSEQQIYLF